MITINGKPFVFPPNAPMSVSYTVFRLRLGQKLSQRGLVGTQVETALETLEDWAALPDEQTREQRKQKSMAEVFLKEFKSEDDMFAAAAGHTLAAQNRAKEERLAFAVLERLKDYEQFVLNPLLETLVETLKEGQFTGWRSYYGEMSDLKCQNAGEVLDLLNAAPELERLYRKVAFLHDYCRNVSRFNTPGRSDHAAMRSGKWTLVENDLQVKKDRENHVPVWSGTSGSCMDMIFLAKKFGFSEDKLTALAWCIAAFFHFMPIVRSPTHTYHEVMRGAHKIIGPKMLDYDPDSAAVPDFDFGAKYFGK